MIRAQQNRRPHHPQHANPPSYRQFPITLFPAVMDLGHQCALDNRILAELIARPDLSPYDREAFCLALEYNKAD